MFQHCIQRSNGLHITHVYSIRTSCLEGPLQLPFDTYAASSATVASLLIDNAEGTAHRGSACTTAHIINSVNQNLWQARAA